ncbi:MAG: TIGR01777 family protein [Pirellula sp.]|nr:TIGR01777 family protein [Pirellula sp.]
MKAVVTGATGFVGRELLKQLDHPIVLSRNAVKAKQSLGSGVRVFEWDPLSGPAPAEAFAGADAVFHLAGEPVAEGRWTPAKKKLLLESRTTGTANLVRGLEAAGNDRPPVLVSASAIGYYGSRGDETLTESAPPADDFLAQICIGWEREAAAAERFGMRVAMARIGIVLGRGGALQKMLLPFKLGLGGRLGAGKQWMSWVHVDDIVGMFLHAATHADVRGPYNAVGPKPVTNADFTKALGSALHRPTLFPAPPFALRLALGEFAEVLLGSQRCLPKVMQNAGYRFRFDTVDKALADAVIAMPAATGSSSKEAAHA